MANLFENIPNNLPAEHFADLIKEEKIRIERIVSLGHTSPESGWYNQEENEWVVVLQGSGTILFENGIERVLNKGDYLNIPAHTKHKVTRTDPKNLRPMVKIKSPICLSFKPPSALLQWTHILNMLPLACLDGDLKSGASVADLILTMGLTIWLAVFY